MAPVSVRRAPIRATMRATGIKNGSQIRRSVSRRVADSNPHDSAESLVRGYRSLTSSPPPDLRSPRLLRAIRIRPRLILVRIHSETDADCIRGYGLEGC